MPRLAGGAGKQARYVLTFLRLPTAPLLKKRARTSLLIHLWPTWAARGVSGIVTRSPWDGRAQGYECAELISSPAATHVRLTLADVGRPAV